MSNVQDVIFETIASDARIPKESISMDSTLTDLGIDSLEAIEIVFNLEERFKISFPDRDPSFDTGTVRGLVDAVERLLAEQAAAPDASTLQATAPITGDVPAVEVRGQAPSKI